MRRLATLVLLLTATACTNKLATTPTPGPTPPPRTETGDLIGLTGAQLSQRFGAPALQVREAGSIKLQFRGTSCVLDTYLYSERSGAQQKVTHVDARDRDGRDADQRSCIASLQRQP